MEWLNRPASLLDVHHQLESIAAELDDDANVPERYTTSVAGCLSDADSRTLREAAAVLHRLHLWSRYPIAHEDAYLRVPTEPVAGADAR